MGYNERVLERIIAEGERSEERSLLWQVLVESFETKDGSDGVKAELTTRVSDIRRRFDVALSELESML